MLTAIPLAYIGYSSGKAALEHSVYAALSSQLHIRANECKALLQSTRNQVIALSANQECIDAMLAFRREFVALQEQNQSVSPEDRESLQQFYRQDFLPNLKILSDGSPEFATYYPTSPVTEYLQAQYIAKTTEHAYEKKGEVISVGNNSPYDNVHAQFHPNFGRFATSFAFEDVMLVDLDGNLVYTYQKTMEFGTNLNHGPFADSNLGKLARSMRQANSRDAYEFADYERYQPNLNRPSAFLASPIFSEGRMIGSLILQFTTQSLVGILTGNGQWEAEGLGKSGEVYLVGKDKLFRTRSRFMMENPEAALEAFAKAGIAESTVDRIRRQGNVILALSADTDGVNAALAGESGTKIYRDYRNQLVIGSYGPLDFDGTRWACVAEMDVAEAFEPIRDFSKRVIVATVGTCLLITFLGMGLAQIFVAPLRALTSAALRVSQGEIGAQANVDTWDEFRDLANAFNDMSRGLKDKTDQLQAKIIENEELLLNILPAPAAAKLREGDHSSTQAFADVTVLFAQVAGLQDLTDRLGTEQGMMVFKELVIAFDDAAERFGAEKVTTSGVSYLAVCGLSVPRPDHTTRLVDFANELVKIVERFNRDRNAELQLLVGINSGPVTGGVVGRNKFIYDLWGDTVTVARGLGDGKESGICLTRTVYDRVHEQYPTGESKKREIPGKGLVEYWPLQLS